MASEPALLGWSCDAVYEWAVQKIGEKYAALLRQEEVDGAALSVHMEAHLRNYGIPGGPAAKLCLALKTLQAANKQTQEMAADPDYEMKLQTHALLHGVWDVIGTPLEERQANLSELSLRVQAVYHARLREQREAQVQCEEKIAGLQSTLSSLCDQLQIEAPDPVPAQAPLLQQVSQLTTQLEAIKQERERQRQVNGQALEELTALYHTLHEPLPFDLQPLQLGAKRLLDIQAAIAEAHEKTAAKKVLLEAAKSKVYDQLQDLCLEDDEYAQLDRMVLLHPNDIPLSALAELTRRGAQLEEMNLDRKTKLKALARKIAMIWNILEVPAQHRKEFMGGNAGLGRATFEKCEKELAELDAQKKAQLPQLIEAAEAKLRALWQEACVSPAEQEAFFANYRGQSNDAKFTAVRQQMADIEKRLEDMKPIITNILKREKMKEDEREYITLMGDPNRFKIAGLPLKLESMRRNFQTWPRLASKMKQEIEEWEAVNGPLMRNGERLLSSMETNGEFDEGYIPGAVEPKRSNSLRVDPTHNTPRKAIRCGTAPIRRGTPGKTDPLQSARKKMLLSSSRKERENEENHLPAKDGKHVTPKRFRSPLKDSSNVV